MKALLWTLVLLGPSAQAADLTLRFLDVGQGDAVLITSPEGKSVLYDGGRSEARMRSLLQQFDVSSIDLVAASHADSDHITGLIPAIQQFRPRFFLNNGLAGTTATWRKLITTVKAAGTQGLPASNRVINLGGVRLTVIPPPAGMPADDQNLHSVGLVVEYGGFKAVMTGDSELAETAAWLKDPVVRTLVSGTDVYKSIHHGARNGDNVPWLSVVRPANVVVSVGPNNYGHPTSEALNLYQRVGANIFRTDLNGTVTIRVRNTGAYTVEGERGLGAQSFQRRTASQTATPKSATPTPVFYVNCAAVRAAGKAPLLRGQPGYRAGLDRDGDGRACT